MSNLGYTKDYGPEEQRALLRRIAEALEQIAAVMSPVNFNTTKKD